MYDIERLSDMNIHLLKKTCDYLEMLFNIDILSNMSLRID